MMHFRYAIDVESIDTKYIVYINGIKAISSLSDRKGTVMGGLTVSAFLENGINEISIDIYPLLDADNYQSNTGTVLTVIKKSYTEINETPEGAELSEPAETEIFKLIGSLNENLKSTAELSPNYKEGLVKGHAVEGTDFYRISRKFEISGLPEWIWTKATPFEPTDDNMQKLRNAYLEVWQTIEDQDEDSFEELSEISFEEGEEDTFYPGRWYVSLGLNRYFARSVGAYPFNWDDYKLVSFCNGRLIKLENKEGDSPLGFKDDEGDLIATYNPFFSVIDDKLLITR